MGILSSLRKAINDMDAEITVGETNNDKNAKVDISILGETINKIDVELNIGRLDGANTIIEEDIFESNIFR